MSRRSFIAMLTASVFAAAGSSSLYAQTYPSRPIHFVVPFEAGGTTDILMRTIAPIISEDLGQPVIVENRAGGNSVIGTGAVVRAEPDGYTFVVGSAVLTINASSGAKLPYDTLRDLAPIAPFATTPYFVFVNAAVPANSIRELVALAKKSPGKLTYASSGTGASPHLAGAQFAVATGTELLHVPYKGTGPAVKDLIAGHVDMMFVGLPSAVAHVKSGKLKILAVASPARVSLMPDVPTVAEAGVPDFSVNSWFGILAPRGTPRPVKERMAQAVHKALQRPEVVEKFAALGATPFVQNVEQFESFFARDVEKFKRFMKENPAILN